MISASLRVAFYFATLTLVAGGAAAEGDADKGRELAERLCTRCHNIEPGGPDKRGRHCRAMA